MSFAFWAHLQRERRRLAFVTTLAFLAGVLFFWPSNAYLGPVHISIVTGAVYAAVVGCAAALVCVALPRLRFMIEAVAISRLILALAVLSMPDAAQLLLHNPILMALVVVTGGACVSRVLHGTLDRGDVQRFAFGPSSRQSVIAQGRGWQRRFVSWVEGASLPHQAA